MDQPISKQEVLDFLKSHFIMQIATTADNKPHSSVLLYFVDDDFNIYFATHEETYKSKDLQKNPVISLSIWEHDKMLIQADGTVEVVKNAEKQGEIFDQLAEATSLGQNFWPPLFRIGGEKYIVFKITPTWMRALSLVQKTITAEEPPFTELTF